MGKYLIEIYHEKLPDFKNDEEDPAKKHDNCHSIIIPCFDSYGGLYKMLNIYFVKNFRQIHPE